MKFSVLLPTRNRLDLLKLAVETVRRQDYDDWEILISDNCSDEDVGAWVRSLGDPRIRCERTERFIPVTENWNRALAMSTGDYVVMLGDDDGLLQGYFRTLREEIERHGRPEVLYINAYLFAYPGVLPRAPEGFLKTHGAAAFFVGATEPFWLDRGAAHALVRESMAFRMRFDFNMQYAVVSRALIDRMKAKGDFYQSPYPDYYAMNALFLVARVLVIPRRLIVVGISPKSFGFYYFNDKEAAGTEFLKNLPDQEIAARVRDVVLPGTNMNTSWLLAMETLLARYGSEFDLAVDYDAYRRLQILNVVRQALLAEPPSLREVKGLLPLLSEEERRRYAWLLGPFATIGALLPRRLRRSAAKLPFKRVGTYDTGGAPQRPVEGRFATLLEVFERTGELREPSGR